MSTDPTSSASRSPLANRRRRLKRGDVVHVKPGTPHPVYSDLPMGGWTGTIEIVQRHKYAKHHRYWVHFLKSTTDCLHPVYADREVRDNGDGCDLWDNWLPGKALEPGEASSDAIEQPILPEWAQQAGDRRVRTLFSLGPDDDYPPCNIETCDVWRRFLSEHFPLPRKLMATADYDFEELVLRKILGPEDVPADFDDEPHGLYAEISVDNRVEVTRLEDVMLVDDDPYDTLLRDYEHWFDTVHEYDDWPEDDDLADAEEISPADLDRMLHLAWKAAWKAEFGRLPDEFDIERARSLADELRNPNAAQLFDSTAGLIDDEPVDDALDSPEPIRAPPRVGRNDPCPCGSGKKYKKCCLRGG
ncbi:MAG TPA: SEC-C metal-binding domain-containing protein [Pirellulales bacterium]|nr:SEC-C metal-binding domain-containing protein [Pirellulales bacterium]